MQMRKELEAGTWRGQAKDVPDGKPGAKKPVPAPYMSAQYKEDSMRTTGSSTAAGHTDLVFALGPALLMVLPCRGKGCCPAEAKAGQSALMIRVSGPVQARRRGPSPRRRWAWPRRTPASRHVPHALPLHQCHGMVHERQGMVHELGGGLVVRIGLLLCPENTCI